MPRREPQQVYEGDWTDFDKKDRLMCCDCCLLHEMEFRVRNGKIQIRMYRNNRATAAYRRKPGIRVTSNPNDGSRRARLRGL